MKKLNNNYLLFYFLSGLLALISFFIFSPSTLASTEVTEDITTDTVWNKAGSPYVIENNIAVLPGATLTLGPGTIVKFDYGYSIFVMGKMEAAGTASEKIYFTSIADDTMGGNTNEDLDCYEDIDEEGNSLGEVCEDYGADPTPSDWNGISFYNTEDRSVFQNTVFHYADKAFELYNSDVDFENLEIAYGESGMDVLEESNVLINKGTINNLSGSALQVFNSSIIQAQDINIQNISNGDEISVFNNSSFGADNLNIEGVSGYGTQDILLFNNSKLTLNHSTLKNCPRDACVTFFDGSGYQDKPSSVSIENSKLLGGSGSGLLTFGEGNIVGMIKNSVIRDFANYGIESYATYTIDARNNFWGDATGPYHATLNPSGTAGAIAEYPVENVLFDPWCKVESCKIHHPVILIPGITGSYLLKGNGSNDEVWPNLLKLLLPGSDSFLDYLALNTDGTEDSARPVVLGDIIRGVVGVHVFDSLIDELVSNGYAENTDLFVFPYDWRKSSAENVLLLKDKIDNILASQNSEKIDIVAHSMGGLIAKKYIKDTAGEKTDKLIFVGTPHLGAPKAFKVLMYGDDMGFNKFSISILKPERAKYISQNMPAVYELLPSEKYISSNGFYVTNSSDKNNILNLDYNQTKNLMIEKGRNPLMFPFAEDLHQGVDNLDLPGVNTFNFIGCGTKTIGEIVTKKKRAWSHLWLTWEDDYDIKYVNGDETVPLVSADGVTVQNKYFVKEITHGSLPSGDGVREDIVALLKGEELKPSANILPDTSICNVPGKVVSVHSPVELHIYDGAGNHTGPNADGDIEENISGVQYDILEGEKFAFLPDGVNYKIMTKATDLGGYNFEIKNEDQNDNVTGAFNWTLIPIKTLQAEGEIWIGPNYPEADYVIRMDDDGDGNIDQTYPVSYDGTAFAEQSTNPFTSNTVRSGGGGIIRKQEIRPITQIAKIIQGEDILPEEEITENQEPIKAQNLAVENNLIEEEQMEVNLVAAAGRSEKNTGKLWVFAFAGILLFGILAKKFAKV